MLWSQDTNNVITATDATTGDVLFTMLHNEPVTDFTEFYRSQRTNTLASNRYDAECRGITVPGIGPIATDRGSQSMITSVMSFTQFMDPGATIDWKLTDGTFTSVDAAGIQNIALAVAMHVQTCFTDEAAVRAQLNAATTDEELRAIDVSLAA